MNEPLKKRSPNKSHPGYQKPIKQVKKNKYSELVGLAISVLISLIAYLPAFHNGLLAWDDDYYIKNNPLIFSIDLKAIFSQNIMGNYHPFTILVFAVEYYFFGLNATGYHAVNILLHLLNVILVFYTVYLLSDKAGVALVASLLFGIHPLHVESVAWVAELKDLLYTFFFLASYIFYLKYLKSPKIKFYLFALLLFSVSLLSKALAASLPVVILLTDYFKGRKITLKTLLEKLPFLLLALTLGLVAVLAQRSFGAISDTSFFTFPQRLVFASYGFISYLIRLMFPLDLCAYYPYPVISGGVIPLHYYAYLLFFLALAAFVIYSLWFSKKLFFGIGFFAVTVFLVLQLLPVGGAIMADRYIYIPSIGIFYLAGEGFNFLWQKKIKLVALIILSVLTVFFSIKTYARCGVWKSDMTLWNDVIDQYQTIGYAYYNRGVVFMNEQRIDEAFNDFNKAIELKPDYAEAYNDRGIVFMNKNREDAAFNDFNKAIELKPGYADAYNDEGLVFMNEKRDTAAVKDFDKAIELNPGYVNAYNNRGVLLMNEERNNEAMHDFKKAIELKPGNADSYNNLGCIFFKEKKWEEAITNYSKVIALKPDYAQAYYNRGLAEFNSDKKDAACTDLKQAANLGYQPAIKTSSQICK
jgi:tetratricopeptide (TPR) repeat protein